MTFKVASTDVAWWHRFVWRARGKPTRSWAACFSDSVKQINFWDMARPLGDESTSFFVVVDGRLLGLKQNWRQELDRYRGGSNLKGKELGRAPRLRATRPQKRAHPTHGMSLKTRRAQIGCGCGHAGCRPGGSSPGTYDGAL
jgi:hypothetical protein